MQNEIHGARKRSSCPSRPDRTGQAPANRSFRMVGASMGNIGKAADGLPHWAIRRKIAKERRGVDGEQMVAPSETP